MRHIIRKNSNSNAEYKGINSNQYKPVGILIVKVGDSYDIKCDHCNQVIQILCSRPPQIYDVVLHLLKYSKYCYYKDYTIC